MGLENGKKIENHAFGLLMERRHGIFMGRGDSLNGQSLIKNYQSISGGIYGRRK